MKDGLRAGVGEEEPRDEGLETAVYRTTYLMGKNLAEEAGGKEEIRDHMSYLLTEGEFQRTEEVIEEFGL